MKSGKTARCTLNLLSLLSLLSLVGLVACSGLSSSPNAGPALSPGAAACSVASLTNPAAAPAGLGGTGAPQALVEPDPGGIGGTGRPVVAGGEPGLGGTGIVGVVTGFASICVNGVEVEYGPSTPIQRDGRAGQISELAVGQLVALRASGQGDQLRASRIEVLDAAVGPLTALDAVRGRFEVMGQQALALERHDLQGLVVGNWVRVSGQRVSSGEIRATRVQRVEPGLAWISGPWDEQGLRIGNTPVSVASQPKEWLQGVEVGARGQWVDGRLRAQSLNVRPTRSAVAGSRDVLLQGYVHEVRGRELRLGYESLVLGEGVRVEGGDIGELRADQPVQVRGHVDEQSRVTVEKLVFRIEGRRGADRSTGPVAGGAASSGDAGSSRDDGGSRTGGTGSSGSSSSGSGSGDSGRGRGRGRGGDSGSSGSGSSGSGSSGSGSSGSGSSGSGSSGSGSSGSDSSGGGDSGSGRGRGRGRGGRD